jgi:NAD(P)-dependent dehydrogenase (short-subunit alcohol dehydrogenase family)
MSKDTSMPVMLVTGASRGIGRATALLAAQQGWAVVVNYATNRPAAEAVVQAIMDNNGQAVAVPGDVSREVDVAAMFDAAQSMGSLRGVVANAGVIAPTSALADADIARLRRVFEVNVLGSYLTAREVARRMPLDRGGQGGALVVVSSVAARLGSPFEYVDYAGSKGALDTLTVGLAKELAGQGVRVNAVRPGLIDTEIHIASGQPQRAQVLGAQTPMGRAGTADEVAQAIVWLLSDAAAYVTGALIDVSGAR